MAAVRSEFLLKTLLILILIGVPPVASAESLRIFIWRDYISKEMVNRFEQLRNVNIQLRYFKTERYRNFITSTSRAQRYDLVLIDNHSLYKLRHSARLRDLSPLLEIIGHNFDPYALEACSPYGVPYAWGTMGIYYRASLQPEPIDSWTQLFQVPKAYEGGVLMSDTPLEGAAVALMAAGKDPFSTDIEDLKQAHKLLQQQHPQLLALDIIRTYLAESEESQSLSMAMGFSGNWGRSFASTGHDDWTYVIPKEGTLKWAECLVIPADAIYGDVAQSFLQFISETQNAASNAEEMWFATPHRFARQLTSNLYRSDPVLFPSQEQLRLVHPYQALSAEQLRTRSRMMFNLR